tara:strand:+ start:305 stop:1120 length:816 start_codon:yes stop_codon:yes gene_type:complete
VIGPIGIATLFAVFVWWVSTGTILLAVRIADRRRMGAHFTLTVTTLSIFVVGLWGYYEALGRSDIFGSYFAFVSVLAIWAWIELAFLSGVITGPNKSNAPKGISEWERFVRAWGTVSHHELLLLIVLIGLCFISWGQPNLFGLWTFSILYFARISAKLNLYFGVPFINTEFIPKRLRHMLSYFRKAKLNWFFPVSVTTLTFAVALFIAKIYGAQALGDKVGYTLLAALSGLALLEHWLMVVPLPDAKLWRWMLPSPNTLKKDLRSEDAHGL